MEKAPTDCGRRKKQVYWKCAENERCGQVRLPRLRDKDEPKSTHMNCPPTLKTNAVHQRGRSSTRSPHAVILRRFLNISRQEP
ncbi:MAG TPA: hypothetical protein DEB39_16510 [Planctomycetaceae bacterium]|nr:hypothetical protein [Planctomycetaceae bacterium]